MYSTQDQIEDDALSEQGTTSKLLLLLLGAIGIIALAGIWLYQKPSSSSSDQVTTPIRTGTATTGALDTVTIGIKSAPLGFYGQTEEQGFAFETPTFNFNANIFEGLTTFTKDLKFASRQLVESWDNPKDTTWRLRLRKGVKFHNGDDFTAEDAKYSIDFGKKYVVQDELAQVEQVRIIDPYTIEIDTKGPHPLLLNRLINVYVLDKKYVTANGFDTPNGTGPYKFVTKTATDYTLAANPNYYLGAPKIKNVVYRVVEDDLQRVDALLAKHVDIIEDVPATRIAALKGNRDFEFKGVPSLRVIYLGMDIASKKLKYSTSSTNPFAKLEVRQAIYQAINETDIIATIMGGHAYNATQPTTSVNFGFNPDIKRSVYDPENAKKLLAKAGFPNGFDVTLDVPNNRYQNDELIGKRVVSDLAKVGIKVTLNPMPKKEYFQKVLDNFDTSFYLLGWSEENGDAIGAYSTLLKTYVKEESGIYNVGRYSNSKVDSLIEKANTTINTVERLKVLQELAKTAMDDTPIVPLHQQEDSFGVSTKLDWTPRRDNGIRAYEISAK